MDQLGFGFYKVPAPDAQDLASTALDAGYRHLDTAAMYGNEAGVGRAIGGLGPFTSTSDVGGSGEQHPHLSRGDLFVTTKVWNDDHGYDATLRAFDSSMSNLGLEYLDLYLIHWPCPERDLYRETWRALETLYAEGRVRAIGVSNFQARHLDRLLASADVVPAVNQIELHPWLQQRELRLKHEALGIRTEAWSPLGRGQVLADPVLVAMAADYGRTPAQVILRWHIQHGNVVIPKASSEARIRENHRIFDFHLSGESMAAIDALDRDQRTGSHPDSVN